MPRSRRRRRRRDPATTEPRNPAGEALTAKITPAGRRPPPATVVLALCLGIWIGLAIASGGPSLPTTIALWVSVIGAGLAGGRLLRRWLQRRAGQ